MILPATNTSPYWQTIFRIVGFDRVSFVSDVTHAIPQDEHCRFTSLSFETDGVRVDGWLTLQLQDQHLLSRIDRQLRSVRGLVSVKQTA